MLWTRNKIVVASLLTVILASAAIGLLAFRAAAQNRPPADTSVPDVYALLLIEDEEARLLPGFPRLAEDERDPSAFRRTQAVLLQSRSVLRSALKDEKARHLAIIQAQTDPVRWLEENIKTAFLENTGILRISLGAGRPEERVILINAVVAAYLMDVSRNEGTVKMRRRDELRSLLDIHDQRLREKRVVFERITLHETAPGQSDLEDLPLLRKKLLRIRLDKAAAQARIYHHRKAGEKIEKGTIAKLEEEIAVLSAQEELLKKDITSLKNLIPNLERLKKEIAAREQFHKELMDRLQIYEIHQNDPSRVRLLQEAEAPGKEKKE